MKPRKLYYLIQPISDSKLIVWTDLGDSKRLTTINGVRHASRPHERPPYWILKVDPRWPLSYYHKCIHDLHVSAVENAGNVEWQKIWDRRPHVDSVMPTGPDPCAS